jgi:hypothetical protein
MKRAPKKTGDDKRKALPEGLAQPALRAVANAGFDHRLRFELAFAGTDLQTRSGKGRLTC